MDDIREIQLKCLRVLELFDSFCRENNLTYFLVSGTLLGAMRHNGFIPWDDDIDVGMPPVDYNRLVRLVNDRMPVGCCFQLENTKGSWLGLSKFIYENMDIDIFPLEVMPNLPRRLVRVFHNLRHGSFWRIRKAKLNGESLKSFWWAVAHKSFWFVWKVFCVIFPGGGWHTRPEAGTPNYARKNQYLPVQVHVFEGRDYPIPADFEAVLASEYTNWRELPPVEERKPKHR